MHLLALTAALLITTSQTSAALLPRQAPASVYSGTGWIETLTIRSNGSILLNHLDKPELWSLDPLTNSSTHLVTFPNATSTTGITEYAPDKFAVVTGAFNTSSITFTNGSWGVWTVDLSADKVKAELVKEVPESEFWIGITPFDEETVFIADAAKGAIFKLSLLTGEYSVLLQDDTMKAPAGSFISEGIHGIVYKDGFIYYTNTFGNGFYKVKIDRMTGKTVGSVIPIVPTISNPEGFVFGSDGAAYVCSVGNKNIEKVTMDGNVTILSDAPGCSSVAFGRKMRDRGMLYISTNGGAVLSAVA